MMEDQRNKAELEGVLEMAACWLLRIVDCIPLQSIISSGLDHSRSGTSYRTLTKVKCRIIVRLGLRDDLVGGISHKWWQIFATVVRELPGAFQCLADSK